MVQAVIFDMDGLMIDSERITYEIYKEELHKIHYEMNEAFYCTLLGQNKDTICEKFLFEYGTSLPVNALWDIVHEKIDVRILTEKPLKKGLLELLTFLKEHKYKAAVATSSTRNRVAVILEKLGIAPYMDIIVCGDEVKKSKPEPDIFLKAAENLNIVPSHCLVLEDSEFGLKAASLAGMKAICIPDMKYPKETSGAYVLENLSSVIPIITTL